MPRTCTGRPFARVQSGITRLVDVIDLRKRKAPFEDARKRPRQWHEDEPTLPEGARRIVCWMRERGAPG